MTTATTMITDEWDGVHANNRTVDDVSWAMLDAAVNRLDGQRYTQIVLQYPDRSNMIIGGGPEHFNVLIATADDRFFVLRNPGTPEGVIQLIAGGQRGDYPAETLVGRDEALRAARVYLELGIADETQKWIEE